MEDGGRDDLRMRSPESARGIFKWICSSGNRGGVITRGGGRRKESRRSCCRA